MKKFVYLLCVITTVVIFHMNPIYGQNPTTDDPIQFINSRLSVSKVLQIEPDGLIRIKTPDDVIQFNLKDVIFNYNGSNDDHRLRIMGDYCLQYYDDGEVDEIVHRKSFSCHSKKGVTEVIAMLKGLQKNSLSNEEKSKFLETNINLSDSSLNYSTMGEALHFINDNLTYSGILNVDQSGMMVINGPDCIYKVNLKKADFSFTDISSRPQIRIYGDWCMQIYDDERDVKKIARESFQCNSKNAAHQIVKALYYIKGFFTGLDTLKINALKNVSGNKTYTYSNLQEAIDYINERLTISIIMSINDKGFVSMNAAEDIFRFYVQDCQFQVAEEKHTFWSVIKSIFVSKSNSIIAVEVQSWKGIEQYEEGILEDTLKEQTFSCKTSNHVNDVINAFNFIKNKIGSKH